MPERNALRNRAARLWRALWPVVVVAGGAITCDAPTGIARRTAQLSISPVFSFNASRQFAGLVIDQVRLTAVRPPSETLVTRSFAFPVDSPQVSLDFAVQLDGTETLTVYVELLAGPTVMFSGSRTAVATPGVVTPPPPTPVQMTFEGPGRNIGAVSIAPRDSGTVLGGSFPLRVTATDSNNAAVASFYVSWRTNATAASGHTVNGAGQFDAGNSRGRVWVWAETPTGIVDSTSVTVSPVATTIQAFSGSGQTGSASTPLAQPLVARVLAGDGLPVTGVPVTFTVTGGGGQVFPTTVVTDTLGRAATQATLGPSGAQTFSASVPGVGTPATFSAAIPALPTISLLLVGGGNLVPVGGTGGLIVALSQAAPAGGVTVNLTSDSTAYLLFGTQPTTTASITAGSTRDTVQVNGIALGAARVRANATGFPEAVTFFAVTPSFILLNPPNLSVPVSGNASLGVQLSTPAPAGGVAVGLQSTDITITTVAPATVNIAAGQTTGSATVTGVAAGTAGILATATGYGQGGSVVTVGGGGTPASLAKTAGDLQTAYINDTTSIRPQVRVLDGTGAPVGSVSVLFTIAGGAGTIAGSPTSTVGVTNASGFAVPPGPWRMGPAATTHSLVASIPTFPAVPAVTFTATATLPPPVIQLNVFGSNVVGVGRTGQLDVTLLQAAPAGGLTVTVVSDSTAYLTVAAPGTITFAQGETTHSIIVNGIVQSPAAPNQGARVRATAPGYTPDTLFIPVSVNLISLPATLNVPFNQTVSLGITLSTPAPAGGMTVAVSSNDPNIAVTTPSVAIAQGATVGQAFVRGDALGSAQVTATNPNYAPFTSTVTATASLDITQTTINLNASFGLPVTVSLESGGFPVNAPAGGVAVTMTPRNTACAAAASTTIPAGLVSVVVPVTYGGSATLPCSTYVVASGPPGFVIDSVLANVAIQPVLAHGVANLGSGLQRAISGSLGASNHGGTTVHIVSADPAVVRVSPDVNTPGTASIDVPIGIGGTTFSYYIQSVEGVIADTVTLTASAPGFTSVNYDVRNWQSVIDLQGVPTTANTFSANTAVYARIGTPINPTGTLSQLDEIRAGGTPVTIRFGLSDSTVARLTQTAPGRADSAVVTIPLLASNSPTTMATGGAEFDILAGGTVITTASGSPAVRSQGTASGVTTTVTAPTLGLPTINIGSGLQRGTSGSLSASQHGGVTVHLVSADPGEILLAPDANTAGSATLDIVVPNGNTTYSYHVQGVEGRTADTSIITATAPGFTSTTAQHRVWQPVIDMQGVPGTANTFTANSAVYARIGTPTSPIGTLSQLDEIRFGGTPVTVRFGLSDSTVARLLQTAPGRADSAVATIPVLSANSPTTMATGGAEFDIVGAGTVTTSASAPPARAQGTALGVTTTVTAPTITVSTLNIGSGLQRSVSATLGASQHGGVTVHLVSADPTEVLLSPDAVTPGTASLDVVVANGSTTVPYHVQGVEGRIADTSIITVSAPGFTTGTAQHRVWQSVYDLQGVPATSGSLDADRNIYSRVGTPTSPIGGLSQLDEVRAGGTPLTVTFNSSTATVAQLTTSSTPPGSSQTAQIVVGLSNSPTTVAAGGVGLDVLTTGSTTVTASIPGLRAGLASVTMTVNAPTISVGATTVGSGLMDNTSGTLSTGNHNGVDVTVSSSNPAVALVSPNATTAGAASFTVHLNNLQTNVPFYVHGLEGFTSTQVVTIRIQAPGFTDGTAVSNIVQPGIDISGLLATGAAAAADDPFQVRWGLPNAQNTGLNSLQALRFGGPGLTVTVTTTQPTFGNIVNTANSPAGATSASPVAQGGGSTTTPISVASGGVAFNFIAPGIAFVIPTAPGFIPMQQSQTLQDGFRVTVTP